jgi:hypothetical protein
MLFSAPLYAGLFGPSNIEECIIKYQNRVKLDDAKLVVRMACVFAYGDGDFDREQVKVGKCIVSDTKKFYSFESTLKVINKCSGSNVGIFNFYKNKLYSGQNQIIEDELARIRQRQSNLEFERRLNGGSQDGPVTIYDSATGTFKYCHKNSGVLTCF